MAVCRYHTDRQGIGVCMRCKAVICAECSTRFDGINHCHACLTELGRKETVPTRGRVSGAALALLLLGAAWFVFTGLFWLVAGTLAP